MTLLIKVLALLLVIKLPWLIGTSITLAVNTATWAITSPDATALLILTLAVALIWRAVHPARESYA